MAAALDGAIECDDRAKCIARSVEMVGFALMFESTALIVHERQAEWARQLRSRVVRWPARLIETRSRGDLEKAVRQEHAPLAVVDLKRQPRAMLDDLAGCRPWEHDVLALVLDPDRIEGATGLAWEAGASCVASGFLPPPRVVELLDRWRALRRARAEGIGWTRDLARTDDLW